MPESKRQEARKALRRNEWTSAPDLFRSEDARIDGDWSELLQAGNSRAAWHGLDPADIVSR
jgi:hypothetical protein